jgi:hypothetical protein
MKNIRYTSLLLTIALYSICATAQYTYDYKSGNSYSTTQSGSETQVRGYNSSTGESWNTRIDKNGNQHGSDAQGNYWNYNNSTGTYYNSNGKTCYGKGAARTCN